MTSTIYVRISQYKTKVYIEIESQTNDILIYVVTNFLFRLFQISFIS